MSSVQQPQNPYASFGMTVSQADAGARSVFLRKTYTHLAAAIYLLVAIDFAIFRIAGEALDTFMIQNFMASRWSWLLAMGAFIGVSMIADNWARSDTSRGVQYAGLVLYVVAEALILVPLLWIADRYTDPINLGAFGQVSTIALAALITLALFAALTAAVVISGKDFSFLGTGLKFLAFGMIALILVSIFTGMSLGLWFSGLGIGLAGGYILYSTSGVMHHYRTDQYVAAALALFAAVALLFWYVLQILISLSGRD